MTISLESFGEVGFEPEKAAKYVESAPVSWGELEKECGGDIELEELLSQTLDYCARYTETVFEYNEYASIKSDRLAKERLREIDDKRKHIHDATIDSINILARELTKKGKRSEWVSDVSLNRASYGRFAILLTFERMIKEKGSQL